MTRIAPLLVVFALSCSPALAQSTNPQNPAPTTPTEPAEPDYPIIRVGVLSYVQYDDELKNRGAFNAFDVTRGYLNVNGQLAKNVRFRLTPDIKRATADTALAGSLVMRIKYAFVEFDPKTPRSWVRFGAHQTPWLDFEESINRYRVQGTMFSERESLIPGSSDFGVGYFTPVGKYLDIDAGVYNGEGYAQPEGNRYKSVQGRLTGRPFAGHGAANGLRVSGFYSAGSYAANRPRRLGIVMGSFEHANVVATLQYLRATENPNAVAPRDIERSGASGFLEIRQGLKGWAALARVDHLNIDRSIVGDYDRRVIAGGAYWFVWPRDRVGIVLTNEQVHYGTGAARPDENRILVQTHVEF
jgi:phosphate-selective porin O/P